MALPKISVIVPSYNQARFIEATLQSIISQNYPNLELIVVDGASTDGSIDVIRRHDNRITYWVSEADDGQTDALIRGLAESTGDIQCWLNSDDLLMHGALHEVAEYFVDHPEISAVFGDGIWIDQNDKPLRLQREIPFNRFVWMYTYNYIPGMSMFWRRGVYETVGGLNRKYQLAMDADLWIRFADVGRIAHVRRVWSKMRFYPEQKNQRLRQQSDAEDRAIRARYWGTERPVLYTFRRVFARFVRVAWKLATGCYLAPLPGRPDHRRER